MRRRVLYAAAWLGHPNVGVWMIRTTQSLRPCVTNKSCRHRRPWQQICQRFVRVNAGPRWPDPRCSLVVHFQLSGGKTDFILSWWIIATSVWFWVNYVIPFSLLHFFESRLNINSCRYQLGYSKVKIEDTAYWRPTWLFVRGHERYLLERDEELVVMSGFGSRGFR